MKEEILRFAAENTLEAGVLPMSISVEDAAGMMVRVADVGTRLPVYKTMSFSADIHRRRNVEIRVYAGERPFASQNELLFTIRLNGISEMSYGEPQITLKFEIRTDGVIIVNAVDEGSLREGEFGMEAAWIPNGPERAKVFQEAIDNAARDSILAEKHQEVQKAKELVNRAQIMADKNKRFIPKERRAAISEAIKELTGYIKGTNPGAMNEEGLDEIRISVNRLKKIMMW